MHIIDLLKGNAIRQKDMKSSYCKKITLSHLTKYYEECVKKVQTKILTPQELKSCELVTQPLASTGNSRRNSLVGQLM